MEEPRYNFGLKTVLLSTQLLEDGTTLGSWRDARGAVVYLSNVLRTDVLCHTHKPLGDKKKISQNSKIFMKVIFKMEF